MSNPEAAKMKDTSLTLPRRTFQGSQERTEQHQLEMALSLLVLANLVVADSDIPGAQIWIVSMHTSHSCIVHPQPAGI